LQKFLGVVFENTNGIILVNKWTKGHIDPWWNDAFKSLPYNYQNIKNTWDAERWDREGYHGVTYGGSSYNSKDMENHLPEYALPFLTMFDWKNVGLVFYKMDTCQTLPLHQDAYTTYAKKFNLSIDDIWRCVVFLEDWKSGHYFEIDNCPLMPWQAGDWVAWNSLVPHHAGNYGVEPRYTMQITGNV